MQLSIIVFAGYFLPFRGGYANSIFQLLSRLARKGYKVTVVTNNTEGAAEKEIIDGVEVIRLSCWNILGGTFPIPKITLHSMRMLRELGKSNYSIVNTQTRFFITSLIGLLFSIWYRIPHTHTERGSYHSIVTNKIIYYIGVFVDHTLGWLMVKHAIINIGVSSGACNFLKHIGARNPLMIPNGVNRAYLDQGKRFLNNKKTSSREVTLLFYGRLIYAKGVQDIIKVVKKLSEEDIQIKLNVVGDGNYLNALKLLVENLNISDKVKFMGELDSPAIIEIMNETDIFVNPSYSEGLPTTVLEAGAAGLAVIATDVGGTKDIITSSDYRSLYKPTDKEQLYRLIKRLIKNQALRQQQGKALHNFISKTFSWDDVSSRYVKLLSSIKTK